ncbi:MAG: hypothetical protein OXL98_15280 [Acidimicrobiaceae bacterium]|nr:hypothetical protein [Acidimicrobiaceae bacterium]
MRSGGLAGSSGPTGCRRRRVRGTASLELVILVPALTALVLLVLWAGAGGRAGLVADLAAEEAAAAAGAACGASDGECLEAVAAEVLASRPGLGDLCVDGPVPSGLVARRVGHRARRRRAGGDDHTPWWRDGNGPA